MPETRPKTKIICTLGPATSSEKTLEELVKSGMSIARLNLSHGTLDEHREAVRVVRAVSERLGNPIGIMVDVPGAKYRTGPLGKGVLNLKRDDRLTLTSRDLVGTKQIVSVSPPGIHRDVTVGHSVLVDDGLMEFCILGITLQN